ncbi:uncharacterized protein BDZ83DRAFT_240136 [Colletotrichum acutatum]|uniref:Uncharacterized protein n=1 Tax=Glomerella acutata TaxID=27357 RepID=A0AAD8U959_GLOAC|nr:uncharacterized protein BDZ83DRAFT_240136 [Colletotrichum acutatum]KAK1703150.1 hypothetical protein BDZ83DRAFT_240136 [Colletotrichum acutatum]
MSFIKRERHVPTRIETDVLLTSETPVPLPEVPPRQKWPPILLPQSQTPITPNTVSPDSASIAQLESCLEEVAYGAWLKLAVGSSSSNGYCYSRAKRTLNGCILSQKKPRYLVGESSAKNLARRACCAPVSTRSFVLYSFVLESYFRTSLLLSGEEETG